VIVIGHGYSIATINASTYDASVSSSDLSSDLTKSALCEGGGEVLMELSYSLHCFRTKWTAHTRKGKNGDRGGCPGARLIRAGAILWVTFLRITFADVCTTFDCGESTSLHMPTR
jgi:hypothetical protein